MGVLNLLIGIFLLGSGEGTTAFPLLRIPYGPKACSMGESFAALADDATSIFWNPAGLGNLRYTELFLSHHEWFQDIRDENLILVYKTPKGTFGASILLSTIDDIEARGPDQRLTDKLSASSGIFTISYGRVLMENLSAGVSLKALYDNLDKTKGKGWCMDIGWIYKFGSSTSFGANIYNLGPDMDYDDNKFELPSGVRTGVCISPVSNFLLLMDLNLTKAGVTEVHTGGEVKVKDIIAIRAGYRNGPQETRLGMFTIGFGIEWERFDFDYAYVPYGILGNAHRFSLKIKFPPKEETH